MTLLYQLLTMALVMVHGVNGDSYTIFHASNFAGRFGPLRTRTGLLVGGLPRLYSYMQQYEDHEFIITGNFIRRPYSMRPNRVLIEHELLKILRPTAITLGFNEYHLDIMNFQRLVDELNVSVISTAFDAFRSEKYYRMKDSNIVVLSYVPDEYKEYPLVSTSSNFEHDKMIKALKKRIEEVKKNSAKEPLFIASGCAGIDVAKGIAEKVADIDIILSGCSPTMQWNEGEPPEYIKKDSAYPLLYETKAGKTVIIAHSYGSSRFLGKLVVNVDAQGEIHSHDGIMLYLDNKYSEDDSIYSIIEKIHDVELAHTRVFLNGQCGKWECNLGNLIADSFIHHKVSTYDGKFYSDTSIALMAAKNIKSNVEVSIFGGVILIEDLLYVINPHQKLVTVELKGSALRKSIEYFMEKSTQQNGLFLQVSGLHIRYDRRNSPRKRLIALMARCIECEIPTYTDMAMGKRYKVVTTKDMLDGSSGHFIFGNASKLLQEENTTDFNALRSYMKQLKYIHIGAMERIRIVKKSAGTKLIGAMNLMTVLLAITITRFRTLG